MPAFDDAASTGRGPAIVTATVATALAAEQLAVPERHGAGR